jgi:uncharacterized protein (DUF58 family)
MQTLIPDAVSTQAQPWGRAGRVLGWSLSGKALVLLAAGLLGAVPAFFHTGLIWMMFAWDGLIAALALLDAVLLPAPQALTVTRRFIHSPAIGIETEIDYEVEQASHGILAVTLTDALHPALLATPQALPLKVYPRETSHVSLRVRPRERGDLGLGRIYLRYRGLLGLAERWAACAAEQNIRV